MEGKVQKQWLCLVWSWTPSLLAISSSPYFPLPSPPPPLQLLEAALRTYPASTTERWVRIAEAVPSRTKAECITRFKVRPRDVRRVELDLLPIFQSRNHLVAELYLVPTKVLVVAVPLSQISVINYHNSTLLMACS